jgi:hypothetical protein
LLLPVKSIVEICFPAYQCYIHLPLCNWRLSLYSLEVLFKRFKWYNGTVVDTSEISTKSNSKFLLCLRSEMYPIVAPYLHPAKKKAWVRYYITTRLVSTRFSGKHTDKSTLKTWYKKYVPDVCTKEYQWLLLFFTL